LQVRASAVKLLSVICEFGITLGFTYEIKHTISNWIQVKKAQILKFYSFISEISIHWDGNNRIIIDVFDLKNLKFETYTDYVFIIIYWTGGNLCRSLIRHIPNIPKIFKYH